MNPAARKALLGKVRGILSRVEVAENFPKFDDLNDRIVQYLREAVKARGKFINESDAFQILLNPIYRFTTANMSERQAYNGKLVEITGEDLFEGIIQEVVDYLESLPRDYSVYIPLKGVDASFEGDLQLAESVSILAFTDRDKVPGGMSSDSLVGLLAGEFPVNEVFFELRLSGYCGTDLYSNVPSVALSQLKVMLQQGLALKVFKQKEPWRTRSLFSSQSNHEIPKLSMVCVDTLAPGLRTNIELPFGIAKILNGLTIGGGFVTEVEEAIPIARSEAIHMALESGVKLIAHGSYEAQRVRTGAEWCFDALQSDNETLAFIQTCIGLEALLGHGAPDGALTSTLADRCAFLIGKNFKSRDKIRENFLDFYKVRCKLVHGERIALEHKQKWYLDWGKYILNQVIAVEIQNLDFPPADGIIA